MEEKMSNRDYESWGDLLSKKTIMEGDCLIWQAGTHAQGYPMVRWDHAMVMVNRKLMEDKLGVNLERNQRVKNTCGNILCVNIDHQVLVEKGSKRWASHNVRYKAEERANIVRLYEEYAHPKTGTKWRAFNIIRDEYPKLCNTTIIKILKANNPDYSKKT